MSRGEKVNVNGDTAVTKRAIRRDRGEKVKKVSRVSSVASPASVTPYFELDYKVLPNGPKTTLRFDGTKHDPFDVMARTFELMFPETKETVAPAPVAPPSKIETAWREKIAKKKAERQKKQEGLF